MPHVKKQRGGFSTEGRRWKITRENYIKGNYGRAIQEAAQTVRNRIRKAGGRGLRTAGPDCYFAHPLRSRSELSARKETRSKQRSRSSTN